MFARIAAINDANGHGVESHRFAFLHQVPHEARCIWHDALGVCRVEQIDTEQIRSQFSGCLKVGQLVLKQIGRGIG